MLDAASIKITSNKKRSIVVPDDPKEYTISFKPLIHAEVISMAGFLVSVDEEHLNDYKEKDGTAEERVKVGVEWGNASKELVRLEKVQLLGVND